MVLKRLGDYVKIKTGKLDANASSENGKYPFFTCSVNNLWIDNFAYDCECVLIAGNGDLNVKYYEGKFNAYQRTYIVESNDKTVLDVRFLYYFMSKYIDILRNNSIGGVIKYIKLGDLTEALIPIPPLETQKKIVEVLDKAQGLIDARKEQIRLMDELIQSVFYEMFGERKIYPLSNMNDICIKITDGTHQSPQFVEQGIPFLFVSNIVNGKIIYNTSKFISRNEYESLIKRTPIEIGDILYTIVGSYGNPAIVKSDKEFCFQRHIGYLKPNKAIVDPEYLATAMVMPDFKYQLEKKVKGVAQKTLNLSELKTMQVILPPIKTQYLFRDKVEGINNIKEILNESLLMLETSFKSLMISAFKGELLLGE